MMVDLTNIIDATKNGELHWERQGESWSFIAFSNSNCLYSVSELSDGEVEFEVIDEKGNKRSYLSSSQSDDENNPINLLTCVIDNNKSLQEELCNFISIRQLTEQIRTAVKPDIIENTFYRVIQRNEPYIEPQFSQQVTTNGKTPIQKAQIVAISAPGATGKTALTEYLSQSKDIPIFDMHEYKPVGGNTLLGMLYNSMQVSEFAEYIQSLKDGKTTMIIDALDEGYVKTNHSAFDAFLDDLVSLAAGNSGLPFIILGRTSILEYVTLYLEEHGVRVCMLQIEPFAKEEAKKFIDVLIDIELKKQVSKRKEYQEVRDYILGSLEEFFADELYIRKLQSERFIGYAPVLKSIEMLLVVEQNYFQLKEDLERNKALNTQLVRDIVEKILDREQDKVRADIHNLLEEMDYKDTTNIVKHAYDKEEQCARVLYSLNNKAYPEKLTNDSLLNEKYEELINRWFGEHPFIVNNKIQNIVFEGYIVSRLITKEKYRDEVLSYLDKNWRNSYILFDLYNIMVGEDRKADNRFVKYLIDSYKATEKGDVRHLIDLVADDEAAGGAVSCELSFEQLGDNEYEPFIVEMHENEELEMSSVISNLNIDAPINVTFGTKQVELSPMVNISCKKMTVSAEDVVLTPAYKDDAVVIECREFKGGIMDGKLQHVVNKGNVNFKILTDSPLYYPFASYKKDVNEDMPLDSKFFEKYQKMRRTIIQFRAYGKGNLAKYKYKIENRIGATDIGRKVIDGLLKSRVLEEKKQMYFINDDRMGEVLGLNYYDLRTYVVNDKVKAFLNSI